MRGLLPIALTCSVLAAALVSPCAPGATTANGQAESPPWVIANGHPAAGLYMPREVERAFAKGTRGRDGEPGPNDWQNHAEHRIRVRLKPPCRRVRGEQEISTPTTARTRWRSWSSGCT